MSVIRHFASKAAALSRAWLSAPVQPDTDNIRTLHCRKADMEYIACSNIICHIPILDGYFCECRKHSVQEEYVRSVVEDYYSLIAESDEISESDRQMVLDSLLKPENTQKFMHMGENRIGSHSPCAEFIKDGDAGLIGMEGCGGDAARVGRMRRFVGRYAWCEVLAYHSNRFAGIGNYQTRVASRAVATAAMAGLLGLSDLIPQVEYVFLVIDDAGETEPRFGTFMQTAQGICAMDIPHETRSARLTPEFQKTITAMNLLDTICPEGDHSPNNYNVVLDENGMATGVSVFDNNGISTFAVRPDVEFESFKGCSPFVKNGIIHRPHMSSELAERLGVLRKRELSAALRGKLNRLQIYCTWRRIQKIVRAIEKTEKLNASFLLDDDAWSSATMEEELSGAYGKTYLLSFLNDCKERARYSY